MSSRWTPILACGAIAGCLVGNYDVNPALDGTGDAGSGASQASAGKTSANEGGRDPGNVGGEGANAGEPTSSGGAVNGGASPQGAMGGEGGEPPLGGAPGGPVVGNCAYNEQADASNEHASPLLTGTAEATGQSSSGEIDICGKIDVGHFAAGAQVVDIDSYTFNMASAGEVYAVVEFAKGVPARDILLVVAPSDDDQRWVRSAEGTGVLWSSLPAGLVTVSVAVLNDSALAQSINYRIRIRNDDFDERCPRATAALPAGNQYDEMSDGTNNQGNDVLRTRENPGIDETASAVPSSLSEDGLAVGTNEVHWARGSIGLSTAQPSYGYEDGDAYDLLRLGPSQLSVRLDWDGSADLDLFVFDGAGTKLIARSVTRAAGASERLTFPPNTIGYMIWVAGRETGLPQAYDVTVCGEGIGQ